MEIALCETTSILSRNNLHEDKKKKEGRGLDKSSEFISFPPEQQPSIIRIPHIWHVDNVRQRNILIEHRLIFLLEEGIFQEDDREDCRENGPLFKIRSQKALYIVRAFICAFSLDEASLSLSLGKNRFTSGNRDMYRVRKFNLNRAYGMDVRTFGCS